MTPTQAPTIWRGVTVIVGSADQPTKADVNTLVSLLARIAVRATGKDLRKS
jgi:hypothetical protein